MSDSGYHDSNKSRAILKMKHDEINIGDIACRGDVLWEYPNDALKKTLLDNCVKYASAQAILDGLVTSEDQIFTRDIYPDLDFTTFDDKKIEYRDWFQDWRKNKKTGKFNPVIYKRDEPRLNTAMVVYGVKNMDRYNAPKSIALDFRLGGINSSVRSLLNFHDFDTIIFKYPIMMKKGEHALIQFIPKHDTTVGEDKLALLGVIAGDRCFVY